MGDDAATVSPTLTPASPAQKPGYKKIRVLQLGASLAIGGSERLMVAIGQGLDPERFETLYAAVGNDGPIGERLRGEGRVAVAFHRRAGFDYRLYARIWKMIRREAIDIVQTHHVTSLIYGGLPAKMAGAKLVHTEHDTGSFDRYPRNLAWLRRLKRLPDVFVAIDPVIGEFFQHRVGASPHHIAIVRNGIDLTEYRPSAGPAAAFDPNRPFVVGWVGRMDIPKRPDVLVDALARLAPTMHNLRAKIIGPGNLVEPNRQRAASLGIAERIEFLGARHDVAEQLRGMDCCVLVSEREGLPFTLVEAMATALPCIASAVGGIPDLIQHEVNGLLLDGGDAGTLAGLIQDIANRPEWARELGRRARAAAVDAFDVRKTAEQYTQMFTKLAAR